MGRTDWDRLLNTDLTSLTDEEIEELCPTVIECEVNEIDDIHNLRMIMKLSQEILQYKDNQVEVLIIECNELKHTISSLKRNRKKGEKRLGSLVGRSSDSEEDHDVSKLDENATTSTGMVLEENNERMKTLLNELGNLDKENELLKERLALLTDEMEDATEKMNEMSEELNICKEKKIEYKEKINALEEENIGWAKQVREITAEQIDRDKVIDEFGTAIDARVTQWEDVMNEKDAEILRLKEKLSRPLSESVEEKQDTSQNARLSDEILYKDTIINELQNNLTQATREINESAALIEKLKADTKKMDKNGRRKDNRELLRKIEESNEKITYLENSLQLVQDDVLSKSEKLCEALATIKKYENHNTAFAETLGEIKELKMNLELKQQHVQDLTHVVNKLEMLNSYHEMEISTLREKLGISEDDSISIDENLLKREENSKTFEEIVAHNKALIEENLDMKSKILQLQTNGGKNVSINNETEFFHSTKLQESDSHLDFENISLYSKENIGDLNKNIEAVIEENEALRKGMHEILDSIRDQDATSVVEIQSKTLEKFLEALDARHLAGWYHPAMRLQERVNVIQGSNAELRNQIKEMRKQLQEKDRLLQELRTINDYSDGTEKLDSEGLINEKTILTNYEIAYKNDIEEWEKQKSTLIQENIELKDQVTGLNQRLQFLDKNGREDGIEKVLAAHTKEYMDSDSNKKLTILQNLLDTEMEKSYEYQKNAVTRESRLRMELLESNREMESMKSKISLLESNLSNSISIVEYDELKRKFEDVSTRYRIAMETCVLKKPGESEESLKIELETNDEKDLENLDKSHVIELTSLNNELREQLMELRKSLIKKVETSDGRTDNIENELLKLREQNETLRLDNENIKKMIKIHQDEAQQHYTLNSLKTLELDNLRHQVLNLQAISDDKAVISKLDFELAGKKTAESLLNDEKMKLETDLAESLAKMDKLKKECENTKIEMQQERKQYEYRCGIYKDLLNFMQYQYAGTVSIGTLERVYSMLIKLQKDREKVDSCMREAKEFQDNIKIQQETLTLRLEIVDRLKDILEEKIGSRSIDELFNNFSESSQRDLNDLKSKRQISNLEYELKNCHKKLREYEDTLIGMEEEMMNLQKVWNYRRKCEKSVERVNNKMSSVYVEARAEMNSIGIQTDSTVNNQIDNSSVLLEEQLNEAVEMASGRATTITNYESQITEYQLKLDAMKMSIDDKDSQLLKKDEIIEEYKLRNNRPALDNFTDNPTLKLTINSLHKIINQKEETITRYQNLLKEDRDEHSRAAASLQDEIRNLKSTILTMQEGIKKVQDPGEIRDTTNDVEQREEITRLRENLFTSEADLQITKELSDRWHRLAEERLKHMDRMRERLEEQHRNELESYRTELNKWQSETDGLRQQLSENRMLLTKGNISLMKELQERDDRINELSFACQQLQNEIELMDSMKRNQQISTNNDNDLKLQLNKGIQDNIYSDQLHRNHQVDMIRRQVQSLLDKEKMYKQEIVDLKQQLSRRYMAVKLQDKKSSQREIQLERKVKSLEEESEKMHAQLDREYLNQEAKRAKTAEELALWEKQKKWQQTAEKLKEKLKEKTDELTKLTGNYDKLRSLVNCMEREKCYLRNKLRSENSDNLIDGWSTCRTTKTQQTIVDSLQNECETLRERVRELTQRLDGGDKEQYLLKIQEQSRKIAALETVSQGNTYVVEQLEKLEGTRDMLERKNLRLESENFELRLELERANLDTPRLREKVTHLEKYIQVLKEEKSSDSTPRSLDKELNGSKKSIAEMEKTIFTLKRIIEKLQVENRRMKINTKNNVCSKREEKPIKIECQSVLQQQYELARKRIITLETDLQLAEQRVTMLEKSEKDDENDCEANILKQQLDHKSELLDKVKQLLTRAAINEKSLRQRIHQLESKRSLSTIPEYHTPAN